MDKIQALKDLELFRTCTGSTSKILSQHRNQVLNTNFAGINSNIMINIAKLNDFLDESEMEDKCDDVCTD